MLSATARESLFEMNLQSLEANDRIRSSNLHGKRNFEEDDDLYNDHEDALN